MQSTHEIELCREFAPRIRLYGLKHLANEAAADDLVQEVLLTVIEAVRNGRVRNTDRLASFVLGTCRNTVLTWRTTGARRELLLERYGIDLPEETGHCAVDHAKLGFCLTRLPPREYQVIFATFYGDDTADTIAADLGTSPGNVRVIRHRALGHLRDCVEGR